MQPPLEVRSSLKHGVRVLLMSKPVRIEDAHHSKSFWKISQAAFKLLSQEAGRACPFTFQDHQVAALQIDPDIGDAFFAATLCPSRQAVITQELSEKNVNAFLADDFRIVLSGGHCRDCLSQ